MFSFYCGKCSQRKAVHNWVEKFPQGRSKVAGYVRPCHIVETATETTVQHAEELIRADTRITVESVATAIGCSHCLA
jgi:hypothetical protein